MRRWRSRRAYDDELLDAHFIAGDGRVNENIALTAVHHVFHSEHNRQVDEIKATVLRQRRCRRSSPQWLVAGADQATASRLSSGTASACSRPRKFATEMQYQHLVFEEFARKVQPNIDAFLMYDATINPAIVAEFAHTVYRFGHSMLTETVDRLDPNFVVERDRPDRGLPQPARVRRPAALTRRRGRRRHRARHDPPGSATRSTSSSPRRCATTCSACRSTSPPSTSRAAATPAFRRSTRRAREFYRGTGDTQLKPYTSWVDFASNLKHPESLINFIAAYGTHELDHRRRPRWPTSARRRRCSCSAARGEPGTTASTS